MPRGIPHDLTGKTFGSWTVIEKIGRTDYGKILWLCRCRCTNEVPVTGSNLLTGRSTQCRGCYRANAKGPKPTRPRKA